jgi:hypothetical protein
VPSWTKKTLETYWSKQFRAFLVHAGPNTFRVGEAFHSYATWEQFRALVTQSRVGAPDYSLLLHDNLLVYEFFMPLTNEAQLRMSLDKLFYRDTIQKRLKTLDQAKLQTQFPRLAKEPDSLYKARLCGWLSSRFSGYSISTVSGRFRVGGLLSRAEAVTLEQRGQRYLVDETTAVARFIFPCGEPLRREPPDATDEFDEPDEAAPDTLAQADAQQIRWFFRALFVSTMLQVVNAEAEVWLVETGMRNRLHIWRVEASDADGDNEADTDLFNGGEVDG